ncbi:GNAT family N-acetyltransferase [Nisaea sp.]|uniref:GNAT family N-acetyltransferase n=1 Tax=Nisaea sp. TaxID=2024842 RepID=UPI0032967CD4
MSESASKTGTGFDIRPADWCGFEAVMGEKGGCGGCWCMLWRLPKKDMDAGMGDGNRLAMKSLFDSGHVPGLVAWHAGEAVGWIQVDERSAFPRLETSRVLKPLDDQPVWSVSCFLVDKRFRKKRLSVKLLEAACRLAKDRGATILEGYPVDSPKKSYPAVYAWTGFIGAFRDAGFEEVARRSETRPIMRKRLNEIDE